MTKEAIRGIKRPHLKIKEETMNDLQALQGKVREEFTSRFGGEKFLSSKGTQLLANEAEVILSFLDTAIEKAYTAGANGACDYIEENSEAIMVDEENPTYEIRKKLINSARNLPSA